MARWESVSEVSGEEFVGGRSSESEFDIVLSLVIVAVVIGLSWSVGSSEIPINFCNIARVLE